MNIGPTIPANGAVNGSGGAVPVVSSEIRQVLTQIAEAPGLADPERAALVHATATASSIADSGLRQVALRQVSTMGLFLSKTGDSGLPRWTVMTALRAYGLNLQSTPKAQSLEQNALAAQKVATQVASVGQSRGVSVQQALQAAPQVQAAAVQVQSAVQLKNAAVVNFGGLSKGADAATLTTQLLSTLV